MEIQFLGATKTVTGSRYLLKGDKNVLIDCGLFQGLKELRTLNWATFPIKPQSIDSVILTHAHLDHTGYLPLLVKNGFKGKIYATPLTVDLVKILLLDSGHLQEEEAYRANKLGYAKHKPALPLYTRKDAAAIFGQFKSVPFHQNFNIGDFSCRFDRAGHIFGAASVLVKNKNTSILFSGDVGCFNNPCVLPPDHITEADYLVIESTYGDRLHENVDPEEKLGEIINKVVKVGGTLIIPSFAVGRAQVVLYYIHHLRKKGKIPNIPVFLDSPMAAEVTKVMSDHVEEYALGSQMAHEIAETPHYIGTVDESKKVDALFYPRIIIAASGMVTGGRILHHIKALASDRRNMILFVGYQAEGTRGDLLMHGEREIKIFGEVVKVNCQVSMLQNVSAHADYQEMLNWMGKIKKSPRKVFITHGDAPAAASLKKKIKSVLGWECLIPDYLYQEKLG
jgi:metallo-beta-lactamase family protein